MKMDKKSRSVLLWILSLLAISLAGISCGPASQQQTLHQTKIQFVPETGQTRLEDKFLSEAFQKALVTGVGLGYRVVSASREEGMISFAKEVSRENVPINLNLYIQKEDEKSAYVEIIMQSPCQEKNFL